MAKISKRRRTAQPQTRRKPLAPKKTVAPAKSGDAALKQQLAESRAQQAATAAILKVIARSPSDVQPVLEVIVECAVRLFGEWSASILMREGELVHLRAAASPRVTKVDLKDVARLFPLPFAPKVHASSRAIGTRRIVEMPDARTSALVSPAARKVARAGGWRSAAFVPLVRGREGIGTLALTHPAPHMRLAREQLALAKSFAAQAVIAIENARLFNETKEALEHQTATAEVLQVISGSMENATPVFDRILASCRNLFAGSVATLGLLSDDEMVHIHLEPSFTDPGTEAVRAAHPRPARQSIYGYVAYKRQAFYFPDVQNGPGVPDGLRKTVDLVGMNYSAVYAPLMWQGRGIGALNVSRFPPAPFSEKEIRLLKTFTDQAVIAIQNARLFRETREALERQTATADILKVISSSPTDVQPVFDAISLSAARLFNCRAGITLREGDSIDLKSVAQPGLDPAVVEERFRRMKEIYPLPYDPEFSVTARTIEAGQIITIEDTEAPGLPEAARDLGRRGGYRSATQVPLVRDGIGIGTIVLAFDEPNVRPNEKQMALLQAFADQAVIAIENVRLFKELEARNRDVTEALEHQTATAEVLRVISGSLTDTRPVFDAIARACQRLFRGQSVLLGFAVDGMIVPQAGVLEGGKVMEPGLIPPFPIDRGSASGVCVLDRRTLNLGDLNTVTEELPRMKDFGLRLGYQAGLWVPLLRGGEAIGILAIARRTTGAFTEQEATLAQTFADQAVIAIENVRLFNETKEALEQQTASSEILGVISSSPTDLAPVFDAILHSATRLCDAHLGVLNLYDGENYRTVAQRGGNPEFAKWVFERGAFKPVSALAQMIAERKPYQFADLKDAPAYRGGIVHAVNFVELGGARSYLTVPLIKEDKVLGGIAIYRPEVRPFTEKQVDLVKTFANQAVIAIENVRLFNETKEALERQTATADILGVISSSPTDLAPVFGAILSNATRLCEAHLGILYSYDGSAYQVLDMLGSTPEYEQFLRKGPIRPGPKTALGRVAAELRPVQIEDVRADSAFAEGDPLRQATAKLEGTRTLLMVPMLKEGRLIGTITVYRREVRAFSEKQLALLRTFADQAVIAIENVRLFNETKEALEQQTATADILKVISSSPTDTQPVFEAIVQSGLKLFPNAAVIVTVSDGDQGRLAAIADADPLRAAQWKKHHRFPLTREYMHAVAILDRSVIDMPDAQAYEGGPLAAGIRNFLATGNRAVTIMPMLRADAVIGTISVIRLAPGPLTEKQFALLRTFADQAVIAIENVRLFNETKEALEQQTATAEILKVIASSPSDVQPVFDEIVESAARLFAPSDASVHMIEPTGVMLRAVRGPTIDRTDWQAAVKKHYPLPGEPVRGSMAYLIARRHLADLPDTEAPGVQPHVRELAREMNFRSILSAPLVREGVGIGAVSLSHPEANFRWSDAQRALLQTFADQAMIAIENVRLFNETKEALERQTATAEVLQVISSSVADAKPVFTKILQSCQSLFASDNVALALLGEDDMMHLHLVPETPVPDMRDWHRQFRRSVEAAHPRPARDSIYGYAAHRRQVLHFPDVANGSDVPQGLRKSVELLGTNYSVVYAPLLWEGRGIGALNVVRVPPAPFSEKEISLLKTFADQAVIAIQNARLFNETKEALERQTATAEILKVISESPTDVQPVFDAIARSAARVFRCNAGISSFEDDWIHLKAMTGPDITEARAEKMLKLYPIRLDPDRTITGRAIRTQSILEILDAEAENVPEQMKAMARAGEFRSITIAPLVREDKGIGSIALSNWQVGFHLDDKQKALLQTFTDQAVIAIENVRLFKELQSRTDALTKSVGQLTALGEVSQALSSTLDLDKVLQTIVSRAVQLTGLDGGAIYEYDEAQEIFLLRSGENIREEIVALNRTEPIRMGEGFIGRAASTRKPVQVPDLREVPPQVRARDLLLRVGFRALLAVPLVREDHVLGALAVVRNSPGEFPPEVIALLETFATQSAIAIQNARLFREIEGKSRELQVASEHKSQFLASMSHELRTPLNAILGLNEMMLGEIYGEVPEDMKPPLAQTQASGKHLLSLINNVLDLAKIEANRMELALTDFVAQDLVASVRATLEPLANEKGLEFVAFAPDDLPLAYGDPGRLTQCLINLAGNSLKFTKEGRVEIRVEAAGEALRFSVADTGIGIAPGKIEELFTEFKQTDATIAREYGGTGLGLAITKKFIELHGGSIRVESEIGKGSTFIFEVPLRAQAS